MDKEFHVKVFGNENIEKGSNKQIRDQKTNSKANRIRCRDNLLNHQVSHILG